MCPRFDMLRTTQLVITILMVTTSALNAMVYDNRYFPLIQFPWITVPCHPSHFTVFGFATSASRSFDINENESGIPEFWGKLDLGNLVESVVATGKPNLLRPDWQAGTILYDVSAKIQSQAFGISFQQSLTNWLQGGWNLFFMRAESSPVFFYESNGSNIIIADNEINELNEERRAIFRQVGLTTNHSHQIGISDIDAFVRIWHDWYFALKCRRIEFGARFGGLFPTGEKMRLDAALSEPFGGNGFWGVYGQLDNEFEIREDWKAGSILRFSQRFAKTMQAHMPSIGNEPQPYGAVIGDVTITPGFTFVFGPYVSFENLREGFGAGLQYTLTLHRQDSWCDARCDKTVPVSLQNVIERTGWASDYFTFNVFYDFGKTKTVRSFDPIVYLRWDVPAVMFRAHRVVKAFRVVVGLEFNY